MQITDRQNNTPAAPSPENFYQEIDSAARLSLLNTAIDARLEPEENSIRRELFSLRYEENKYAESGYADIFMRAFINIGLLTKSRPTKLGMNRAKKKMLGYLKTLGLDDIDGKSDIYRDLLFREYCHMGQEFIVLSSTDKHYSSILAGFGKIKKDKLEEKLLTDFAASGIDAWPERAVRLRNQ